MIGQRARATAATSVSIDLGQRRVGQLFYRDCDCNIQREQSCGKYTDYRE